MSTISDIIGFVQKLSFCLGLCLAVGADNLIDPVAAPSHGVKGQVAGALDVLDTPRSSGAFALDVEQVAGAAIHGSHHNAGLVDGAGGVTVAVLITFGHIVAGGVHLGGAPQPAVRVRVRRTAIVLCTLIFGGGMVIALKTAGFVACPPQT